MFNSLRLLSFGKAPAEVHFEPPKTTDLHKLKEQLEEIKGGYTRSDFSSQANPIIKPTSHKMQFLEVSDIEEPSRVGGQESTRQERNDGRETHVKVEKKEYVQVDEKIEMPFEMVSPEIKDRNLDKDYLEESEKSEAYDSDFEDSEEVKKLYRKEDYEEPGPIETENPDSHFKDTHDYQTQMMSEQISQLEEIASKLETGFKTDKSLVEDLPSFPREEEVPSMNIQDLLKSNKELYQDIDKSFSKEKKTKKSPKKKFYEKVLAPAVIPKAQTIKPRSKKLDNAMTAAMKSAAEAIRYARK